MIKFILIDMLIVFEHVRYKRIFVLPLGYQLHISTVNIHGSLKVRVRPGVWEVSL